MARRNPRQQTRRRPKGPMGALQSSVMQPGPAELPQNPNHFLNRFPSFQDYTTHMENRPNATALTRQQYGGLSPRRRQQGAGGGGGGGQQPGSPQPSSYIPPIVPPASQPTPQTAAGGGYTYDPANPTAGYANFTGSAQDWWNSQVPLFSQGGYTANGQKMNQVGSINTGNTMPQVTGAPSKRMYQWGHEPTWGQFVQDYGALPPATSEAAPATYPFSGMGYQAPPINYSHYLNPGIGAITRQQVLDWNAAGPNTTNYYDPGETVAGQAWNPGGTYLASFSGPTGNAYGAAGRDRVYGNPVAPNYYDPYTEYQMLRDVMKPVGFGGVSDAQQQALITNAFGGMATPQTSLARLDWLRYQMGAYGPAGNPWESYATQHGGIPASQRYASQLGGAGG